MKYVTKQAFRKSFGKLTEESREELEERLDSGDSTVIAQEGIQYTNRSFTVACSCGYTGESACVVFESGSKGFTMYCPQCGEEAENTHCDVITDIANHLPLSRSLSNLNRHVRRRFKNFCINGDFVVISHEGIDYTNRHFQLACACGHNGNAAMVAIPLIETDSEYQEYYTPCPKCGDW